MEDVLRRRDRGSSSLYDEVEGVVSSLSSGLVLVVGPDCGFTGCTAEGFSLEKKGSREVKDLYVSDFESDTYAEQALDLLEDSEGTSRDCDDHQVKRNGRLVEYEYTCDIDVPGDILSYYYYFDF